MTNREFLNDVQALCALFSDQPADCVDIEALSTKAAELLAAMDAKNEKAKARPKKENADVTARRAQVVEFFKSNDGEFTADEVAEQTGLTAPQIASAVRSMGDAITKGKRKIDSKHSKVTYKRAE
ncbi:MAG: hypothetical protein J6S85_08225 [Methanobrevibacter sp.]|nr:hypothetical protein [Methanobrevibacter sp.]